MKFTTTSEASSVHGVKMLVYSEAGMGKTMLCATAPAPLILSAEAGLLSLRRKNIERMFGVNTPGIAYEIPVLQIETHQDLSAAYQFIVSDPRAKQFKTICLDSISEIAERILANALKVNKDGRAAYGQLYEELPAIIRAYRDLVGYHVYFSAKLEPVRGATGIVRNWPSMPGNKLGPELPYYFDEVFKLCDMLHEGKTYRALQTSRDSLNEAKDRSGTLSLYEQPNLTNIINKVLGD